MASVLTKEDNYRLLTQGAFGNTVRTWNNVEQVLVEYSGIVSIRTKQIGTPTLLYDIHTSNLIETVNKYKKDHNPDIPLVFCESPPNNKRTIQGELIRNHEYYYFYYSFGKKPMRLALEEAGAHARGLHVHYLLKKYLNANSYEDLMELMDLYPDSVIELSCFSINLGTVPNRNTIIWEVSDY